MRYFRFGVQDTIIDLDQVSAVTLMDDVVKVVVGGSVLDVWFISEADARPEFNALIEQWQENGRKRTQAEWRTSPLPSP